MELSPGQVTGGWNQAAHANTAVHATSIESEPQLKHSHLLKKAGVPLKTLFALCLFAGCFLAKAQTPAPFVLNRTIPLTGVSGHFDHLAIDDAGQRLFIAATTNHSVEVINLKTNKVEQSISGLGKPHGLAWVAATGSLYIADGALGELRVYQGAPLALAGKIKLSDDADDMVYDEAHQLLFVGHGGKDAATPARVAIVNTVDFSLLSNVPLATHPEGLAVDPDSGRVFVNVADVGEVAVIDSATRKITAHWKLTKAADNVPIAFDVEHNLLYVACRTPGTLIAFDANTGKEIANLPTADGADDLFYDSALGRVYVISGAGEVDAYQTDAAKNLRALAVLHTAASAKTALFVPSKHLLYVGVPGVGQHVAEVRVYSAGQAQAAPAAEVKSSKAMQDKLIFAVIVSRHGVRSPTGKTDQLNQYSAQPWPAWSVPPGYLTKHGAHLMTLVGAYDRELLASQGLLAASGCDDAAKIRIIADSDQRTRETGKALAEGLAPGCAIEVIVQPEGTTDPLFHSLSAGVGLPNKLLATAAISGRIGGNPQRLTEAYRPQLKALEEVLLGCKTGVDCPAASQHPSLFDLPSLVAPGTGDHLVDLRTPLSLASSMTENLLLEYTEGMDAANVGWGRVDLAKLCELLQLHEASEEIERRTPTIARIQSSNLLAHILDSMRQALEAKPVAGALTKPGDRLLILVGHDTNLSNIAGTLGLDWIVDGRRNDTPPGGALVFELWKKRGTSDYSVRTFYTAQTLDQMRTAAPLSLQSPPDRAPVFVPGCSQADYSCEWNGFQQAISAGTNSRFVM
jgi:4-phytase/acid phosphatase